MFASSNAADVAIVGAGPAGLTAGYLLTKSGHSVILLEKDPVHVGGLGRTVEHGGFRFDIGGHPFVTDSRPVADLWDEMLPGGLVERPWSGRILHGGRFHHHPLRAPEAMRGLGLLGWAACLASRAGAMFPRGAEEGFEDWSVRRFGRRFHSVFVKPYAEKIWGVPCAAIPADRAARLVEAAVPASFRYPRRGSGMLWEAARDRIVAGGNRVLMGHALRAMRFEPATGRWHLQASDGAGGIVTVNAAHVISSAPMRELAGRIQPMPANVPAAMALHYRDMVTVALMIRAEDLFPDNCLHIHEPGVRVARVRNFRAWSPEMAPEGLIGCVGLDYFCAEGDGLWDMADRELVALAVREMAMLGLASAEQVVGGAVVRQEKARPIDDAASRAHADTLRRELEARYPTLHLVGRNGMHRALDPAEAMTTAMLAVRNIAAGARLHDAWSVGEDGGQGEAAPAPAAESRLPGRLRAA